jgi:hypothetical protein
VIEEVSFENGREVARTLNEVAVDQDGYLRQITYSGSVRLGFQPTEIALFQDLDGSGSGWDRAFAAEPAQAHLPRLLLEGESATFRPQVLLPECDRMLLQNGPAHIPRSYRSVPLR